MTATVRAAALTDAAAIAAIYAPYVTDGYASFEAEPPPAAEYERRMSSCPRLPWLVAELFVGVVANGHDQVVGPEDVPYVCGAAFAQDQPVAAGGRDGPAMDAAGGVGAG